MKRITFDFSHVFVLDAAWCVSSCQYISVIKFRWILRPYHYRAMGKISNPLHSLSMAVRVLINNFKIFLVLLMPLLMTHMQFWPNTSFDQVLWVIRGQMRSKAYFAAILLDALTESNHSFFSSCLSIPLSFELDGHNHFAPLRPGLAMHVKGGLDGDPPEGGLSNP